MSQLTVLDDGVLRAVDATHRVAVMSAPRTSAYNVADHQTQRGITKKSINQTTTHNARMNDDPPELVHGDERAPLRRRSAPEPRSFESLGDVVTKHAAAPSETVEGRFLLGNDFILG